MRLPTCALLSLVLLACDNPAAPAVVLEGEWQAISINGAPLPVTYSAGNTSTTVVERRLTLTGNLGTWHDDTEVRVNGFMQFRRIDFTIEWTRAGNEITAHSTTPGFDFTLIFNVSGDQLVHIDADGKTVRYQKQP